MRFVKATVGLVTKLVIFCLIVVGACTVSAVLYAAATSNYIDKEWEATHPPTSAVEPPVVEITPEPVSRAEVQGRAKDLLAEIWSIQERAKWLNERLTQWHKDACACDKNSPVNKDPAPRVYIGQMFSPESHLLTWLKTDD